MHINMYIYVIFLKYCYVWFITDSVDGIDTDKDVVEEHTYGKGRCIQNLTFCIWTWYVCIHRKHKYVWILKHPWTWGHRCVNIERNLQTQVHRHLSWLEHSDYRWTLHNNCQIYTTASAEVVATTLTAPAPSYRPLTLTLQTRPLAVGITEWVFPCWQWWKMSTGLRMRYSAANLGRTEMAGWAVLNPQNNTPPIPPPSPVPDSPFFFTPLDFFPILNSLRLFEFDSPPPPAGGAQNETTA